MRKKNLLEGWVFLKFLVNGLTEKVGGGGEHHIKSPLPPFPPIKRNHPNPLDPTPFLKSTQINPNPQYHQYEKNRGGFFYQSFCLYSHQKNPMLLYKSNEKNP